MTATGTILPLQLDGLAFEAAGKRLIDGISLTLGVGPRTVILGPNGAGKSLLLRLCHGLVQPTAGAVRWHGPGAVGNGRRQAMVFQHPVMLRRSAAANIDYALRLKGIPRTLRRARVREVLDDTGLTPLAHRPARTLSIGEQQRLALARAWAAAPEVLFLDEPTANLDPAATRAIEEVIGAIDLTGTKIVMTTHDLGQARRLADEIVFLHRGRLLEQRPTAEFFAKPATSEAAAFIAGKLLW
ncbi:MAG TPA: ATP-binding cassette domain-containing protein [Candidatus Acidoferrum sp.]|nr:ATP-binding cassette domain-containing protein [Candidatus Acidoferrum sp.]